MIRGMRIDAALVGTFAGATGIDRIARASAPSAEEFAAASRFVDQAVLDFIWGGVPVYLTPTDVIALLSGAILLIRFAAWALAPLMRKGSGE